MLDVGATSLAQSLNSQTASSALALVSQMSSALNAHPLSSSQQQGSANCNQTVTNTTVQQLRAAERSQLLSSVATVVAQSSASTPLSVDTAAQVSQTLAQITNEPGELNAHTVNLTVSLLQATLNAAASGLLAVRCLPS